MELDAFKFFFLGAALMAPIWIALVWWLHRPPAPDRRRVRIETVEDNPLLGMTLEEAEEWIDLHELRQRRIAKARR